jgi:predicted GTPase
VLDPGKVLNGPKVRGLRKRPQTVEDWVEEVQQKQANPLVVMEPAIAVRRQIRQRLQKFPKAAQILLALANVRFGQRFLALPRHDTRKPRGATWRKLRLC